MALKNVKSLGGKPKTNEPVAATSSHDNAPMADISGVALEVFEGAGLGRRPSDDAPPSTMHGLGQHDATEITVTDECMAVISSHAAPMADVS